MGTPAAPILNKNTLQIAEIAWEIHAAKWELGCTEPASGLGWKESGESIL